MTNMMNPIFHEDEDPIDVLNRLSHILHFLIHLGHECNDEAMMSKKEREGFLFLLGFIEETISQIATAIDAERKGERKTEEE